MTFWQFIATDYYDVIFYFVTGFGFLICLGWICFFIATDIVHKLRFARRATRACCTLLEVKKLTLWTDSTAVRFQFLVEVVEPPWLSGRVFKAEYRPRPRIGTDWASIGMDEANLDDKYVIGKRYDCWVDQESGLCCMNPRPSLGLGIAAVVVFGSIMLLILALWSGTAEMG